MKMNLLGLNIFEMLLTIIFRKYAYKIYKKGIMDGFNFVENKKQ